MEDTVLLRQQDYTQMEWKNGGGKTAEIAIHPPDAVFPKDAFIWRLSSARMSAGSLFSQFPHCDRYLALVQGEGLHLQFTQTDKKISLKRGDVCRFSGDLAVSGELENGEVTDLNLIFQKDYVKAHFEIIRTEEKPRSFEVEGKTFFIFAIQGSTHVTLYPGEQRFNVKNGDTLRINQDSKTGEQNKLVLIEPAQAQGVFAVIEITEILHH
jgi:environmental stress-induced protein Ves